MVRSLLAFSIAVATACTVVPTVAAPPNAEPVAAADARAVRSVVSAQLDAFANDDAVRAFSYAAPSASPSCTSCTISSPSRCGTKKVVLAGR